jgi:two-component system sensor histidine kinase VicK
MMSNIFSNAIKFNDKEIIEIKVSARKEQSSIVLEIYDNGPGIPIEDQDKIFEGFYQIEKYFTGNVAGAGLGLPLVKKIVTAHGGTVSIKSDIGRGTTLKITLLS